MNRPPLSRAFLTYEMRQILGGISELVPIIEGEESRVFGFRHGQNDLVLRVNRDMEGFRKDDFAYRSFASVELPIPEIIAIGSLADGNAYCVSRRAIGRTLQDLTQIELLPVLEAVAGVMSAISQSDLCDDQGFGPFDASGAGAHTSWRDFLLQVGALDWRGTGLRGKIEGLLKLVQELAEHCPEQRALVHGDFGSNNVLTDGPRITAVIDWSEALYGDPLYDLANILFWRPWLICMEAQARWFEAQRPEILKSIERLRCYQLHIGLKQIHASALAGHDEDMTWALKRCGDIAGI